MCGFKAPGNHEQAMRIDRRNCNTKFANTENAEIFMIDEFSTFEDLGFGGNPGPDYKKIRVHMVYSVKHDGRHKARLVAGGRSPCGNSYRLSLLKCCLLLRHLTPHFCS